MPALLSIEACLVLYRLEEGPGPSYRVPAAKHDPCVWIRDGRVSNEENFWHCYYADEAISLLQDFSRIKCEEEERIEKVGAITHKSKRYHSLKFKADTIYPDGKNCIDWECRFGNFWDEYDVGRAIARIESYLEETPGRHPIGALKEDEWGIPQLLEYIKRCRETPEGPPHRLIPITIQR